MSKSIILKNNPKIEFQLHDNGFELIDEQTVKNSGSYLYNDLQSIELNNVWYPMAAKWLRAITWIFNGVPFFPDAESCKKSNLIFHFNKTKLDIWLTDNSMASKAKSLEQLLSKKTSIQIV